MRREWESERKGAMIIHSLGWVTGLWALWQKKQAQAVLPAIG